MLEKPRETHRQEWGDHWDYKPKADHYASNRDETLPTLRHERRQILGLGEHSGKRSINDVLLAHRSRSNRFRNGRNSLKTVGRPSVGNQPSPMIYYGTKHKNEQGTVSHHGIATFDRYPHKAGRSHTNGKGHHHRMVKARRSAYRTVDSRTGQWSIPVSNDNFHSTYTSPRSSAGMSSMKWAQPVQQPSNDSEMMMTTTNMMPYSDNRHNDSRVTTCPSYPNYRIGLESRSLHVPYIESPPNYVPTWPSSHEDGSNGMDPCWNHHSDDRINNGQLVFYTNNNSPIPNPALSQTSNSGHSQNYHDWNAAPMVQFIETNDGYSPSPTTMAIPEETKTKLKDALRYTIQKEHLRQDLKKVLAYLAKCNARNRIEDSEFYRLAYDPENPSFSK